MSESAENSRRDLAPWQQADLPQPPYPRGLGWIAICGPGVIVLGVSIGSGEFLLGPATFVRHGLSLLWVTLVAVFFQTVFNTEVMRYTLATGEPVVTGFHSDDEKHLYGAPVGVVLDKQGALLVADDVGDAVWRVTAATH